MTAESKRHCYVILSLDAKTLEPRRVFLASASPMHLTRTNREVWTVLLDVEAKDYGEAVENARRWYESSIFLEPIRARFPWPRG